MPHGELSIDPEYRRKLDEARATYKANPTKETYKAMDEAYDVAFGHLNPIPTAYYREQRRNSGKQHP